MGRIETKSIIIPYTNKERTLRIYLPEGYDEDTERKFPTVYMHDGQNIFTGTTAFGGCSWGIYDTLNSMEIENKENSFIVVGIDNAENERFSEYSPWKNTKENIVSPVASYGGNGDMYADFFVNNLKNFIDNHYRTKSDYENTSICGSSMGGFISAYIAAKYPKVFSKVGVFSLASWFAEEPFLEYIANASLNLNQRYFVQVGANESSNSKEPLMPQIYINNTLNYVRKLIEKGISIQNIYLGIGAGDSHNEKAWSKYMKQFFEF